jgi:predicted dinucleotide-binding enzyme
LLELLTEDVNWPNGDARLIGKAAVRQYWPDQFAETRTHDEPVRFVDLTPERSAVHLAQTVEDRHGRVLSRGAFRYSFAVSAGLISRLDIAVVTTIGFIGSGEIGSTLARLAVDAGYDVVLSNSRGPESLAGLVGELGPSARAATADEAAAAGDVVVVAIPLKAYRAVPVRPLAGKVVIDTNNYFPHRDGEFPELEAETTTTSELLQRHLPTSRVVKAFNNISAGELATQRRPAGTPRAAGPGERGRRRRGEDEGRRPDRRVRLRRRRRRPAGRGLALSAGHPCVGGPAGRRRTADGARAGRALRRDELTGCGDCCGVQTGQVRQR